MTSKSSVWSCWACNLDVVKVKHKPIVLSVIDPFIAQRFTGGGWRAVIDRGVRADGSEYADAGKVVRMVG